MWQTYLRDSISTDNPFRRAGLFRRTLLLFVPLAVGLVLFPFEDNAGEGSFFAALGLALLCAMAISLVPWDRLAPSSRVVPLLLYISSVAFLRHSAGGGTSGYGPLLLIPIIWAALFADRTQVVVVLVAIGLAVALPPLIVGDTASGEWRRALLTILAAAAAALAISALVAALREEMEERSSIERRFRQAQAFEMNDAVVQDLAVAKYSLDRNDTTQAREALERALEGSKEIVATLIPDDEPVQPGDLTGPRPPDPQSG
jgi:hypothetical protein